MDRRTNGQTDKQTDRQAGEMKVKRLRFLRHDFSEMAGQGHCMGGFSITRRQILIFAPSLPLNKH